DWLKIRSERTEAFAVIGFTEPKGSRSGFGGLHLARPAPGGGWAYVGRVGSGFGAELLEDLRKRFEPLRRPKPVTEVPKADKSSVWLTPEVVIEVTYLTQTEEGIIRQSRFRALRDESAAELAAHAVEVEVDSSPGDRPREVKVSNPGKIFFPEHGITKGELIEYHRAIAPFMLPYLKDRPIALARYPDGIYGKSFFQKHAPAFVPGWVRTAAIWSEQSGREREQFVIDDVDMLVYLINLGCIPIHAWTARVETLLRPDWVILDLDPKEAPFAHVVEIALAAKTLADELEIPAFVKTSGASGLHVLVPLGARFEHAQAKTLAHLLAALLVERLPKIATVDRSLDRRDGKVYIDFVQNGRGRLLAAPYTVRERPGAPVSCPLDWSELGPDLGPRDFTIRDVPARMADRQRCPLAGVLGEGIDLEALLERVSGVPSRK
ncbi:MAG: non-homologous end-joining DNA ligase, partial [Myxococcota bacterium]